MVNLFNVEIFVPAWKQRQLKKNPTNAQWLRYYYFVGPFYSPVMRESWEVVMNELGRNQVDLLRENKTEEVVVVESG